MVCQLTAKWTRQGIFYTGIRAGGNAFMHTWLAWADFSERSIWSGPFRIRASQRFAGTVPAALKYIGQGRKIESGDRTHELLGGNIWT